MVFHKHKNLNKFGSYQGLHLSFCCSNKDVNDDGELRDTKDRKDRTIGNKTLMVSVHMVLVLFSLNIQSKTNKTHACECVCVCMLKEGISLNMK